METLSHKSKILHLVSSFSFCHCEQSKAITLDIKVLRSEREVLRGAKEL